jgi:predicted RNase H-like HicB family nuclease
MQIHFVEPVPVVGPNARPISDQETVPKSGQLNTLVIEATEVPDFFGFYSPELEGFSGVGHSVEDCLYKARWGMNEHLKLLAAQRLPIPTRNPNPTVTIRNEASEAVA